MEENLELNEKEKEIIEAYRNLVKITGSTSWVVCNPNKMWGEYFLPVSLVQEKIEELKENNNGDDYSLENVIMILQELLREE